jgi:ABC-type polysaccharide/polyol phosphate transport system ATPase subunit
MSGHRGEPLLECRGVVKRFHAYEHRTTSLQEFFTNRFRRGASPVQVPRFHLSGIDISVYRDESVALIGANGSGKSTVLRLMAGISPPTEGRVIQNGRVVPIIELGATFQPALTGEENVALYAAALGLTRREVLQHLDGIFEFAGVEEFRHVPLKYYSSGMRARLAFSIASRVRADVLLLDEILAVGDAEFSERCRARLNAFRESGRSMVVVSHDLGQVRDLCTRAVWLEHGRIREVGPVAQITEAYEATALAGI